MSSAPRLYLTDCAKCQQRGRVEIKASFNGRFGVPQRCPHCGNREIGTWTYMEADFDNGAGKCTEACRTSKHHKCRCACGGANHGLDATSRWATPTLKD